MIVGVCVVIALLIVGAAAYQPIKDWWDLREFRGLDLAAIGAPGRRRCQDVETKDAERRARTTSRPASITYEESPPAFGPHWDEAGVAPAPFERKFYTAGDRPELESLVHNLEHGYTILWYDETIADDDAAVTELRGLAAKFADNDNFRTKFIAAPWTSEDGDAVPRRPARRVHPLVDRRRRRPVAASRPASGSTARRPAARRWRRSWRTTPTPTPPSRTRG